MSSWSLEYTIDVDARQRVVYVKVHGIWKAETARSYHEDFKTEAAQLLAKPWARLIDLSGWKISFPEVTDIIGEHMNWARQNNCKISLYVLNNPSTFRQLSEMIQQGGAEDITKVFRTLPEAEQFLREQWLAKKKNGESKAGKSGAS